MFLKNLQLILLSISLLINLLYFIKSSSTTKKIALIYLHRLKDQHKNIVYIHF